eukprot:s2064_g13.t1
MGERPAMAELRSWQWSCETLNRGLSYLNNQQLEVKEEEKSIDEEIQAAQALREQLRVQVRQAELQEAELVKEKEGKANSAQEVTTDTNQDPPVASPDQEDEIPATQEDGCSPQLEEEYPDNQQGLWGSREFESPEKLSPKHSPSDTVPGTDSQLPKKDYVSTPVRSQRLPPVASPPVSKPYMRNRETREALTPTEPEMKGKYEKGVCKYLYETSDTLEYNKEEEETVTHTLDFDIRGPSSAAFPVMREGLVEPRQSRSRRPKAIKDKDPTDEEDSMDDVLDEQTSDTEDGNSDDQMSTGKVSKRKSESASVQQSRDGPQEGDKDWDLEHVGPALPTEIWSSRLRSGVAHCDRKLAVEVRQCPLGSGARRCCPAVPTGMRSWQMESGSAYTLDVDRCSFVLLLLLEEEKKEEEEVHPPVQL